MSNNILRRILIILIFSALVLLPGRIKAQTLLNIPERPMRLFCDTPPVSFQTTNIHPLQVPDDLQTKLQPINEANDVFFGNAVAISADGNTVLVGASGKPNFGTNNGAAYIFVRNGINWALQARLTASDTASEDYFGTSVALSADGNTALIGATGTDDAGTMNNGTVYFFTRNGATWTQQAKLLASDKTSDDLFGTSIALSADGNIALIGATRSDSAGTMDNGAAYFFTRSGTTWIQQAKLLATDKASDDLFGTSIALSADGSTALVGASKEDDTGTTDNGAVYFFTRSGTVWTQQAKLLASNKINSAYFGSAVALAADGDTALIGAPIHGGQGKAYVFVRVGNLWTEEEQLDDISPDQTILFGFAVALSADGNTALVGVPTWAVSCDPIGTAQIFTRIGSSWALRASLGDGTNPYADESGWAVALSSNGDTAVVGAPHTESQRASVFVFVSSPDIPTPTLTPTIPPPRPDTIGLYSEGTFYLRNANNSGFADIIATFGGDPSDLPVVGDWNSDGMDTIGVYHNSTGFFFLSDSNTSPAVNYTVLFGNPGDTPFAGRWTADMTGSGIGVYRNSNGILYQRKSLTSGFDDFFAVYGNPGDQGFAGDWDGNGFDSIGIYRSSNQTWFLTNNSTPSGITFSDINFVWDISANLPVVGDWDGDGATTVGLWFSGGFTLHSTNASAGSDTTLAFGPAIGKPVSGKWVAGSRPLLSNLFGNPSQPFGNNSKPGSGD